jgi:hypothetical protein
MNFKHTLYCLFSLVFSLNFLSAESYTVWDTFPMKDGSTFIIVDDAAKTVLKAPEGDAFSYQIGDLLEIEDLYKISSNNAIEIENQSTGEFTQTQRLGGLWKKKDGSGLFQIERIKDWGRALIVNTDSTNHYDLWIAKIYVDQEVFKANFHVGDSVYIVHSISFDWPNCREMYKATERNGVTWDNRDDCFINREDGVISQWFYSWDPY